MLVELTEKEAGVLTSACSVLVRSAETTLQAAADVLPIVVKLQQATEKARQAQLLAQALAEEKQKTEAE